VHILLHKLEKFVDQIIPPILVLLLVILVGELFFSGQIEPYSDYVDAFDALIIIVFVADLAFKYNRVRHLPKFLRMYWLQIIAVFPFFLIFRAMETFRFSEAIQVGSDAIQEGQMVVHEGMEIEKEAVTVAKISRTTRFLRYFRIFARFPRFLKSFKFYEKPTGTHYQHEKKNGPAGI
jgi:hypothetical protein